MMPVFQTCLNIPPMTHVDSHSIQVRILFDPVNAMEAILQAAVMLGHLYGQIVNVNNQTYAEILYVTKWAERHALRVLKIVGRAMSNPIAVIKSAKNGKIVRRALMIVEPVQPVLRVETQDVTVEKPARLVQKIAVAVRHLIPCAGTRSVMGKKRARLALTIAGNVLVRICTYVTQMATVYTIARI